MQPLLENKSVPTFPSLALMLTLSLLPILNGGFDHHIIYWTLLLLLLVSLGVTYSNKVSLNINFREPMLWLMLFLLWAGISIFWSINPHRTLVEFLQLVIYVLVFFLALQLNNESIYKVGRIALIAGVGIALFGISQYLFLNITRIDATFTNPNPLAIYLVMLFFLGWGYYLRSPNRCLAAGCLLIITALFLSSSRGAFISFFIALPFIFIGLKGTKLYRSIGKTLICLAVALLMIKGIMIIAPYIRGMAGGDLVALLIRPESLSANTGGRFSFWEAAWRLFLNKPFSGYGNGTFYLGHCIEYAGSYEFSRFAHNHYLQVLAELGLLGLTLLVGFFAACGWKIWQLIKCEEVPVYVPGIIAMMVGFLLHIGVDFSWNFPGCTVIFFAGAGSAVGLLKTQTKGVKINYQFVAGILVLLLLLTGWQFSATTMYKQGVLLESQGHVEEAVGVYDRANLIYPINSMSYYYASKTYLQIASEKNDPKNFENALNNAQKAVVLSPVDGMLHNYLGKLYWQAGKLDKAEKHLLLAEKYEANRIGMSLDMGWFYFQQDRLDDAESTLIKGLELEEAAVYSAIANGESMEDVNAQLFQMHLILAEIYVRTNNTELLDHHMRAARELDEEHEAVKRYFGY